MKIADISVQKITHNTNSKKHAVWCVSVSIPGTEMTNSWNDCSASLFSSICFTFFLTFIFCWKLQLKCSCCQLHDSCIFFFHFRGLSVFLVLSGWTPAPRSLPLSGFSAVTSSERTVLFFWFNFSNSYLYFHITRIKLSINKCCL